MIKQNGLNPNLPIEWDRIKRQNFRGQLLTLIQTLGHVRLVSPVQKLGRYRQSKQYKSLYYSVFIGTLPLDRKGSPKKGDWGRVSADQLILLRFGQSTVCIGDRATLATHK